MKSIEFIYKDKTYYALIRTTHFETHSHHYITIMNGKLEAIFFGNHLFIQQGNEIRSLSSTTDSEINELKKSVQLSLYNHFINDPGDERNQTVEKYSLDENEKAVA